MNACKTALFLATALLTQAPMMATAQPRGDAVATVAPYLHPCLGTQCTFSSAGPLVPLPNGDWRREAHQGISGSRWNTADAIVRLTPAVGAPGLAHLQLGVAASLLQQVNLTADGLPGPPLPRDQMAVHQASASATFQDRVSFFDPTLPLGAPLTVSLTWTLATTYCSATHGNCHVESPDPALITPGAISANSNATTGLVSRIQLPGGADVASDSRVHSAGNPIPPGLVTPLVPGVANSLTHSFSVLNGSSYDYLLGASADIHFDAASLVDWNSPAPWVDDPVQYSAMLLDYDSTAHLTALGGFDAQGQPLASLQMRTSQGWRVLAEPLSPVPEPATVLLWLVAGAWWLGRPLAARVNHRLCASLAAALGLLAVLPLGAQPAPPSLHVQGYGITEVHLTYDQTAHQGVLSAGVLDASAHGFIESWALVQFGAIRMDFESRGQAGGGAAAGFVDSLTILPTHPALLGESAVLEWQFRVSGHADLQDQDSTGYGNLTIQATALNALPGTGHLTAAWGSPIDLGPVWFEGTPLPWLVTVRQPFEFGVPFTIGFDLTTSGSTVGMVLATADLRHTATWEGVRSVEQAGVPLPPEAYSLQSLSGTDYRFAITPVPEPATAALCLVGLLLVGWLARQGHRHPRAPGPSGPSTHTGRQACWFCASQSRAALSSPCAGWKSSRR